MNLDFGYFTEYELRMTHCHMRDYYTVQGSISRTKYHKFLQLVTNSNTLSKRDIARTKSNVTQFTIVVVSRVLEDRIVHRFYKGI